MVITYNGDNYFKIQSGEEAILIDPTNQRAYKGTVAVLNTKQPTLSPAPEATEPFWIEHQGEYEIKGIRITGWSAEANKNNKDNENSQRTIYKIEFDDINIGVLGYIEDEPSQEIQEFLKAVDIIIAPASGKPYLTPASLAKILRQIEPGIIIPSLFKKPDEIKQFLKELGQTPKEEEKLVIKKKDIVEKAMTVKVLEQK